jgi:hypothetical protein
MPSLSPLFIVIDLIAILCLITGILVSCLILCIIVPKLTHNSAISHLLLANTCVCTLEMCVSFLAIYGYILKNDTTVSSNIIVMNTSITSMAYGQDYLCPVRSYFLFTGFSLLYTSYCLQAYYRLRQVIFYRKRISYKAFVYIILIQWLFSFIIILPMYLTNSFVYIPTEFFCPIPFTLPWAVAYIAVIVYGVFLIIFMTIYLWIYLYASRTTVITMQRRRTINRQFIMLKRIIIPTFSLMFLGIVYLTLFFQTLLNHYQTNFLTYRLSYLFIAIGMSFIHLITIHLTPLIENTVIGYFRQINHFGRMSRADTMNSAIAGASTNIQQQQQQQWQARTTQLQLTTNAVPHQRRNKIEPMKETIDLAPVDH